VTCRKNKEELSEEVQELLAQVHAEMGDRDPAWSSDDDGIPM